MDSVLAQLGLVFTDHKAIRGQGTGTRTCKMSSRILEDKDFPWGQQYCLGENCTLRLFKIDILTDPIMIINIVAGTDPTACYNSIHYWIDLVGGFVFKMVCFDAYKHGWPSWAVIFKIPPLRMEKRLTTKFYITVIGYYAEAGASCQTM